MSSQNGKAAPAEGPKRSGGPVAGAAGRFAPNKPPKTEVLDKPKRRSFTAEYKTRIVEEADRLPHGEVAAMLRREGLYSSQLSEWRKLYQQGGQKALSNRRGPRINHDRKLKEQNDKLEKENARLRHQLAQAEKIIEIQKKVSEILALNKSNERPS